VPLPRRLGLVDPRVFATRRGAARLGPPRALAEGMGILDALLGRLGYVKLSRYGLERSAEGRIATAGRQVFDDGNGGLIVGWRMDDPAPTVLEPLDVLARGAAGKPRDIKLGPATGKRRLTTRTPTLNGNEEEEWEWQLALARARADAEDVEVEADDVEPVAAVAARGLPQLVEIGTSQPVGVATLTPARGAHTLDDALVPSPPVLPSRGERLRVVAPPVSVFDEGTVPIDRARMARSSASPPRVTPHVMSAPRRPRTPKLVPAQEPDPRAAPMPEPDDITKVRIAPARAVPRPAELAAAAAEADAAPPTSSRFDSEITKTTLKKAPRRFSARLR
jgi:hypothetical protein